MSENWTVTNWSISSDLNNYKTIRRRNMNLVLLFSVYSQLTATTLSLHQGWVGRQGRGLRRITEPALSLVSI